MRTSTVRTRRRIAALATAGALTAGLFAFVPLSANAVPPKSRSNWTFVSSGILTAPTGKVVAIGGNGGGHDDNSEANGVDYSSNDDGSSGGSGAGRSFSANGV
jgi:hypothetical protein